MLFLTHTNLCFLSQSESTHTTHTSRVCLSSAAFVAKKLFLGVYMYVSFVAFCLDEELSFSDALTCCLKIRSRALGGYALCSVKSVSEDRSHHWGLLMDVWMS